MQIRLSKEYFLVVGGATKDGEEGYKVVGDNAIPTCSFGLGLGKDAEGNKKYANCKAWRRLAEYARHIKKADVVLVIGKIEQHEYNGKTYKDLVPEWIAVMGHDAPPADGMDTIQHSAEAAGVPVTSGNQPSFSAGSNGDFVDISGDDDLPF